MDELHLGSKSEFLVLREENQSLSSSLLPNGFKLRSSEEYSGGRGMSCEWRRLLEMDGDAGRRVTLPDAAWKIV